MSENQVANQQVSETKTNDKELNFRAMEAKHRREIENERQARIDLEKRLQDIESKKIVEDDDEDEPYVGHKKLDKRFNTFEKRLDEKIHIKAEERAREIVEIKEQEQWIKQNNDFSDVLKDDNLMKLLNKAPAVAESIKRMPDGFEKQKLVYNMIKSMGIDKPEVKQSSVQDKIDANRRSPYYQPSGVGAAPYAGASDFSKAGQKNAYDKMQELKSKLRM